MEKLKLKSGLNKVPTSEGLMEVQSMFSKREPEEPRKERPKKCVLILPGSFYYAELVKDFQRELLESLQKKFVDHDIEVHALSLPGRGESELKGRFHLKPFNAIMKVLEEIMEKLGEETILVGHSIGGMVIQKYLEKHLAPAAILLAPANRSPHLKINVGKYFIRHHKRTMLTFMLTLSPKRVMRPAAVKDMFYSKEINTPEYNDHLTALTKKLSNESLRFLLGAFTGKLDYEKISRTPICIFGGEKDVIARERGLEWLKNKLDAELIMIPNATHSSLVNDKILGITSKEGQVQQVAKHTAKYLYELAGK
ncbi:MAG: alpha/beta hydrolase [Promethearchaeota archaeon]